MTVEKQRLIEDRDKKKNWRHLGPYLSERQWGTVREDYSQFGSAWDFISHDAARSKAFRWGEEGIGGISDERQLLCFAFGFWNKKDSIIKERMFGLTALEGNHGEDCKELYYYLDSTPTHSYMKMLYKYPQNEFPYAELVHENKRRGKLDPEFELVDTGVFRENRYFDIFMEYAKDDDNDMLIKVTIVNRGPELASLHVLPQLWFRNTWSWGYDDYKPKMSLDAGNSFKIDQREIGKYQLHFEGSPDVLFCENETNGAKLYHAPSQSGTTKDGINDFLVKQALDAVNHVASGTKAALNYDLEIPAGQSKTIRLRLTAKPGGDPLKDFDAIFDRRLAEANEFYEDLQDGITDKDNRNIQRQAHAGMLWSKQFYYYDARQWLTGDPSQPPPPPQRKHGRNSEWTHLHQADVISMPDKWEYPWYAAWDLAFHTIPIAQVDPEFAKKQLLLLTKEWYMHPNGQLPAYEWAFGDVNPPVHGWASWRVYKIDQKLQGKGDRPFLEEIFHKLLLNFTWWVNKKDAAGNNIFQGGFLGMDNIGVFDRSAQLPTGGHIEQSDGTSWVAMFTLNMLRMSVELAKENPTYQSLATKFFEHFLYIAGAMANVGDEGINLWDEEDEFFYDVLHTADDRRLRMKVRSMVGLIPLFAVEVLDEEIFDMLPEFKKRTEWFLKNRPDLANLISRWGDKGKNERHLLSLLRGHRMKKLLHRMLDESEFLSEFGIRALSKQHEDPYKFNMEGVEYRVKYTPGESDNLLFGGNSNWRGPIWFPVNYLLIESLQRFYHYYGDDFKIEHPTGSGKMVTLMEIANDLSERLVKIFKKDKNGKRPVNGANEMFQNDPNFTDYVLFYEYFHGDNGRGVGASHQTGWTGLVAKLIQPRKKEPAPNKKRQMTSFTPSDLLDYGLASSLEWLETNGLGGYASSTVSGANTRRYHGLLVASKRPPVERMVVLSKLDETVIIGTGRIELGTNQYPGTVYPEGYKLLRSFRRDLFPEFTYQVGDIVLKKTIAAVQGENTTLVIYEVTGGSGKFKMELLPLCSSRDFHTTTHTNDGIYEGYVFDKGIFQTKNYEDSLELFIAVPNADFTPTQHWYHNFEFSVERERGLDFNEDLYSHGVMQVELKKGDTLGIIISTEDPTGRDALTLFETEKARRETLFKEFGLHEGVKRLALAADQFIVRRGTDLKSVIAGYHWFGDWGRDTMISLPGLCLVTGRYADAKRILQAFADSVSEGMVPNRFPDYGEAPEFNTVDATLWFFHAVHQYYKYTGDKPFIAKLIPILKGIVDWHDKGTRYNIHVDADELLYEGVDGVQLTWMDAKVGDWVVTPRKGKAVEVNALWYNALSALASLLAETGSETEATRFGERAAQVSASFNKLFWNKSIGCLYDYVDGDYKNDDIRPNQIYALSLPFTLLTPEKAQKVFSMITKRLLTPRGLRSLSPDHKDYRPVYNGGLWQRDGAYHQGSVWSFLLGPYIDALIKVKGEKARVEASRILKVFLEHLDEAGVGTLSEIFDGEPPHLPRGCVAQAWSVGEVLRVAVQYDLFPEPANAQF